jgi:hypothetical protein
MYSRSARVCGTVGWSANITVLIGVSMGASRRWPTVVVGKLAIRDGVPDITGHDHPAGEPSRLQCSRIVPAHFSWESKAATRIAVLVGSAEVAMLSVIGWGSLSGALGLGVSKPWPISVRVKGVGVGQVRNCRQLCCR